MKYKFVVINKETNQRKYFVSIKEVFEFLKGKDKSKYKVNKLGQ